MKNNNKFLHLLLAARVTPSDLPRLTILSAVDFRALLSPLSWAEVAPGRDQLNRSTPFMKLNCLEDRATASEHRYLTGVSASRSCLGGKRPTGSQSQPKAPRVGLALFSFAAVNTFLAAACCANSKRARNTFGESCPVS